MSWQSCIPLGAKFLKCSFQPVSDGHWQVHDFRVSTDSGHGPLYTNR